MPAISEGRRAASVTSKLHGTTQRLASSPGAPRSGRRSMTGSTRHFVNCGLSTRTLRPRRPHYRSSLMSSLRVYDQRFEILFHYKGTERPYRGSYRKTTGCVCYLLFSRLVLTNATV